MDAISDFFANTNIVVIVIAVILVVVVLYYLIKNIFHIDLLEILLHLFW